MLQSSQSLKQQRQVSDFKIKPKEETDHNQQLDMDVFLVAMILGWPKICVFLHKMALVVLSCSFKNNFITFHLDNYHISMHFKENLSK